MFLAVLPAYRSECIELVREEMGDEIELVVSDAHLDRTVRTGIPKDYYKCAPMLRLFGRAFVQLSPSVAPLKSECIILDLNPRSLSAWGVLLVRRTLGRRTVVWGHIHPQSGPGSWTSKLRLTMRKLASGTISYTYQDRMKAESDLPGAPVWVAPNALYRRTEMTPAIQAEIVVPNEVLYVGRFAPAKKLSLLVVGFALASKENPEIRLRLIGGGSEESELRRLVDELGVNGLVTFGAWEDDVDVLRLAYAKAFCSVSTGFAGLGLTQSLGFGVPMIVADAENHSPEIELHASGGVYWFSSDSPESLAAGIGERWRDRCSVPDVNISQYTRDRYSAEAMAAGIIGALRNASAEHKSPAKDH